APEHQRASFLTFSGTPAFAVGNTSIDSGSWGMQRKVFVGAVVSALVLAASLPAAAGAWAPAATATIHPGVQTVTAGGQCTANFIYQDSGGTYIGQAAHCSSTGEATDTDGCLAGTLPLGTPVEVTGASRPGTLVYSSWVTMQANGE